VADFASRADEIAAELRDEILRGRYRPGERLPSERDLATRMGANRGSVREALKKLEQLRLIDIRRGGGARVIAIDRSSLDALGHMLAVGDQLDPALVAQWLDVHEILMTGAVRFAVERADAEEVERARALLREISAGGGSDAHFLACIEELVELLSVASRNLVLRVIRNGLRTLFEQRFASRGSLRPSRQILLPAARRIGQALAERDAVAAEEGLRELLRAHRERILKALNENSGDVDGIVHSGRPE